MTPGIRPLVAGNWKMNGLRDNLDQIRDIADGVSGELAERIDALICPPATLLYVATAIADDTALTIGAQDCHTAVSGAHTGDISAEMIADCLGTHVIVGHSERRADHGETDDIVRSKAGAAIEAGLVAIICIGETEAERRAGETLDVLARQLAGSVPNGANGETVVIAYEPVWAIGSGLTPSIEDVGKAHGFIRDTLTQRFGDAAAGVRLLYGGSVKPGNAHDLLGVDHVDGALVGGASLKAEDFLAICRAYENLIA